MILFCWFAIIFIVIFSGDLAAQRRKIVAKEKQPTSLEKITSVTDGILYSHEYFPRTRWSVHTVTTDISRPDIHLMVVKGLEHVAGLERVPEMVRRIDSTFIPWKVRAAVNSNFWKASSNHVIGPAVSNGIFINNLKYKNWSSFVCTENKHVFIDRYSFALEARFKETEIGITSCNRRFDSISTVLYTNYFGPSVPFIDSSFIRQASLDTLTDDSEKDSIASATLDSLWLNNPEKGTLKVQFSFLDVPVVNGSFHCRITAIDTGEIKLPPSGGVFSFGYFPIDSFTVAMVGDTFAIASTAFPPVVGSIVQMATGTPRLVRNGRVTVEWREEGLHKLSFVNGRYGRTAIGISKNGKKLILVTCEATNRSRRIRGMSLHELARFMIKKGAYQAMNFDGGSSATMVVNHNTVVPPGSGAYSRKVANALMIVEHPSTSRAEKKE